MRHALAAMLALAVSTGVARAACPTDEAVEALAADILAREVAEMETRPRTVEEGLCAQAKLVERLVPEWGDPIGYKVGLTSEAARERFGADGPVRGVLLRSMLRRDGATIPAGFAARPVAEADLLVTVRDVGINTASTPADVLAHLEDVRPFIELADLVLAEGQVFDMATITGINVGARLGVAGRPVPVEATPEFEAALAEMTVRMSDEAGGAAAELFTAPGAAVLGHPLEAVLWLMNEGVKLEAGDVVSLGSFGPPIPVQPGQLLRATYLGLPGEPSVGVTLE